MDNAGVESKCMVAHESANNVNWERIQLNYMPMLGNWEWHPGECLYISTILISILAKSTRKNLLSKV